MVIVRANVEALDDATINECLQRFVADFGDGELRAGKYVFDQMTRLPAGASSCRMKVREIGVLIGGGPVVLILDPHPQNRPFARKVAESLGAPSALGFRVSEQEVLQALEFVECDMYVATLEKDLLIVGCHEDEVIGGEREIWALLRDEDFTTVMRNGAE